MIEIGSKYEYIERTKDIVYPGNIEKYLEKEYPKNPDLFTDEFFKHLEAQVKMRDLLGVLEQQDPKDIVATAMKGAK